MDPQEEIPKHKKKAKPGHIIIEYRLKSGRTFCLNWGKDWTKWKAYKRQQDADTAMKTVQKSDLWEYRFRPDEKE